MRIKEFEYCDRRQEWELEKIDFADLNLILFVGVSGAGKTRILNSIQNLQQIANGFSLNGVQWNIKFQARNRDWYRWKGEFETISQASFSGNGDESEYKVVNEFLYKNEKLILKRHEKNIDFLQGYNKIPPISPTKSVLETLEQDELIAPVKEEFNRIINSDISRPDFSIWSYLQTYSNYLEDFFFDDDRQPSLEEIRESDFNIQTKLVLVNQLIPEVFEEITALFIQDIFNYIEDIKIAPFKAKEMPRQSFSKDTDLEEILGKFPIIYIKEKGVKRWIPQNEISSGMIKTFMHLSELYLLPDDSVLLIDEFENSLGVNCLDIVTKKLNIEDKKIQFILTSHHPYIINNIEMNSWKIVTRRGSVITVKNAEDLGLGRSRHDAFMQLINSEEYTEGIETEEI